ncbi:MAG: glucose-6-phosphate isomerase [Chlamydiota bacterium]
MQFLNNPHHKKLLELAKNPFDLTKKGALSPERIRQFQSQQKALTLLYATERINQEVMDSLFALAKEANALENMRAMQSGQIVNCLEGWESEDRPALHTAMRDFFSDKNPGKNAVIATTFATREWKKLEEFLTSIEEDHFTSIVQIGIGGSYLGPEALYFALERYRKKTRDSAHFIANVDPDDAVKVLEPLDLSKTLVVVVSKSGSTLETNTNEKLARLLYEKRGLDPKRHFLSVTREKSPMDNPDLYRASFYMEDSVGGRYSVTSMVGCVLLAFMCGSQVVWEFLKGASDMDKVAATFDDERNLPLLGALLGIWNRNFLGYPTLAVIPYTEALRRFPAHLQQCDMESNGKSVQKNGQEAPFSTGPVLWGEPGTSAQHSFYQWLHQGKDLASLEIIGSKESQYAQDVDVLGTTSQEKLLANLFAQSIALATGKESSNPNKRFSGNRPSRLLFTSKITPYAAGNLLSYYEHKIAFQGFIWGINSFDQEGVELGKVLASEILEHMRGEPQKANPTIEAYLETLNHLD